MRCKGARVITKVMNSEIGGKSYNELVLKEVERAVRDIGNEFRTNRVISIIVMANSNFF